MKSNIFIYLVLIVSVSFSQVSNQSPLLNNTVYNLAPEEIKHSKAFVREWVFFEERAYPNNFIPIDAYANAHKQKELLREKNKNVKTNITWTSLGPTPGYYTNYGNISSRIVTGAYHPTNPNILYIGPANGGVWKSTDGGNTWFPLTDYAPSLSMGSIAIDPVNPNVVYAGTGEATYSGASYYGRGLLKTTDGGITWQHITNGLPSSSYFSRLVIRPNHNNELLAALGNSGLYYSTNSGSSWALLLSGRCDDVKFSQTGDTAFAWGSGIGGIKRSIDGGKTFNTFAVSYPAVSRVHFDYCIANPRYMYAAVYASSDVTAWKSTDYGVSWARISTGTSFNGSQAWYDLHCEVNPANPNIAFIGAIDIFRTIDGNTFTNITNGYGGGGVHVDQHYLFFHPFDSNTFICCNDGGIWKSTDGGNSFRNLNETLTLTQFYRIAASPFTPSRILGGTQDNGTQQTYSTLNWAAAFGGDGGEVCFNPFNNQYIIGETQNNGLRRTTNGGTSWVGAASGINTSESAAWVGPIISHPTTSGVFYTARQKLYKSTDNGGQWAAVSGDINGTSAVRELCISKTNPDLIFASSNSLLFKSSNGGVNFSSVSSGLPSKTISSVYVHPANENIVLVTYLGFGGNKIYKSTNGGTGWTSINGDLPDSPVSDVFIYTEDAEHPNTYFVATDIGVFYTQDNGSRWVEITDGLPNTVIKHLDYSPSTHTLRAGTHGRGVYEAYIDFYVPVELAAFTCKEVNNAIELSWTTATELNNRGFEIQRKLKNNDWLTIGFVKGNGTKSEMTNYTFTDNFVFENYEGKVLYRLKQVDFDGSIQFSSQISIEVDFKPSQWSLYQNYPNPFNPTTRIQYSVVSKQHVSLKVYDLLGNEIANLVNEEKSIGNYEIEFNGNNLSSGIYYYKLTTDGFSSTRKLMLLK
jgi:photosystem II stability/assembly factor-like uncharacterized protein